MNVRKAVALDLSFLADWDHLDALIEIVLGITDVDLRRQVR